MEIERYEGLCPAMHLGSGKAGNSEEIDIQISYSAIHLHVRIEDEKGTRRYRIDFNSLVRDVLNFDISAESRTIHRKPKED